MSKSIPYRWAHINLGILIIIIDVKGKHLHVIKRYFIILKIYYIPFKWYLLVENRLHTPHHYFEVNNVTPLPIISRGL